MLFGSTVGGGRWSLRERSPRPSSAATIRLVFQFPASVTSAVDAPRLVSSDASFHPPRVGGPPRLGASGPSHGREPQPRTAAPPSAARAARRGPPATSSRRPGASGGRGRRRPFTGRPCSRIGGGGVPNVRALDATYQLAPDCLRIQANRRARKPVCRCPTGSHRGSTCWCYRMSCRTVAGTDAEPSWTGDSSSNRS